MIKLQERDLKILRHCYEEQFLRMEHLFSFYFKGRHIGEAYRRVKELEEAGYLRKQDSFIYRLLRLTPAGKKIALEVSPWELPLGARINLNYVAHDSVVTTARLRLEDLWDGVWKPSSVLRGEKKRRTAADAIGDGIFQFKPDRVAVIEVETSAQRRSTLIDLLRNWERSPIRPLMVLFVFTQQAAMQKVQGLLKSRDSGQPFLTVLLDDLLQAPSKGAWSVRGELAIFDKRSF